MASSFDRIADIIAENSEVTRDKILPDSHVILALIAWTSWISSSP